MATGESTRTVELMQAFLWTCDDCGRDNFERAITLEPESIDLENLPEIAGMAPEEVREWLDAGGEGAWLTAPLRVRCKHCGSEFDTAEA